MMRRDVFQAVADPTRRAILDLVRMNAMTPSTMAAHFGSTRQAVSKHIHILAECGLLNATQNGREIRYHLNVSAMKEMDEWLAQFRSLWEKRFDQLDDLLNKT